jgi:hypothetical protein
MIHKVGVIPQHNHQQVPFAYSIYQSKDWKFANKFRQTFSIEADIEFIGVWYVSSLMFSTVIRFSVKFSLIPYKGTLSTL